MSGFGTDGFDGGEASRAMGWMAVRLRERDGMDGCEALGAMGWIDVRLQGAMWDGWMCDGFGERWD